MALPPTIPTSFVPKQPVASQVRRQKSGTNIFIVIGMAIVGISLLLAGAVFAFQFYLTGVRDSRSAELTAAQQSVNIDVVEGFIRLRDRLRAVETLLDRHVTLSEFFSALEERTLQTVRFSGLSISVADDRSAEIQMEGTARSFNALAAQSTEIASEKRIKRAIFSDIAVNENGTVGFTLTATVDSRLITSAEILPGISEPSAPAPAAVPATVPVSEIPVSTEAGTTSAPTATTSIPAL